MSKEPTRTCPGCNGRGNTTEMQTTYENGKRVDRNVTVTCRSCNGQGVV